MKIRHVVVCVGSHVVGRLTAPVEFFYSDAYRAWVAVVMLAALQALEGRDGPIDIRGGEGEL